MPRTARVVVKDVPYHVTQRGNRRQQVFFCDDDMRIYLSLLRDYAEKYSLDILAYCLMINHIHLIVIPHCLDSIANTLRILHIRHCQMINARFGWSGHLWQGRYFSAALDDPHLWASVRYVERNPVRAGIVKRAEEYPWSSAAFHLGLRKDKLIKSDTICSQTARKTEKGIEKGCVPLRDQWEHGEQALVPYSILTCYNRTDFLGRGTRQLG